MKEIIAEPGTPVYNSSGSTVLAFFKERVVSFGTIRFSNTSQLLGETRIPSTEYCRELPHTYNTHVYYSTAYGKWVAGDTVVQKDFEDSQYFFVNYMKGPQSSYEALTILVNDDDFMNFITSINMLGDNVRERITYYREILDHQRRR